MRDHRGAVPHRIRRDTGGCDSDEGRHRCSDAQGSRHRDAELQFVGAVGQGSCRDEKFTVGGGDRWIDGDLRRARCGAILDRPLENRLE